MEHQVKTLWAVLIYLSLKLQIDHDDGNFGSGGYKNYKHNSQESNNKVRVLIGPDAFENKEQFHENHCERHHSTSENAEDNE